MECPRHFYYKYILQLPDVEERQTRADQWLYGAALGNLVHGVLRQYIQKCKI